MAASIVQDIFSSFFAIIEWASANHDAIEAISALTTGMFTVVLALSTVLLWRSTQRTAKLTLSTLKLSTDEFSATHRPKVLVQQVTITEKGDNDRPGIIDFIIANAGETKANNSSISRVRLRAKRR